MISCRIPVLAFVAYSGTGKTSLLRRLIPRLRAAGLRLGAVKHAHHGFDIDLPGKDSYELRQAGAEQVLVASASRWAWIREQPEARGDPPLQELLHRLQPEALDLVLVEGFKHESLPKIELHRPSTGQPPLFPGDPEIIAVASDGPLSPTPNIAQLDLNDPEAITAFVLAWHQGVVKATAEEGSRALRRELVRHYRWLRRYGCNDSHSGNASVRDGDRFWVTPTGCCADTLQPEQLIPCPLQGPCPAGASLDAPLHQRVYQLNPRASAVLHSHGPHSVALTLNGRDFLPADFEGQLYFPRVPVIDIPYQDYVREAPEQVAEALRSFRLVIVRGHGVYAAGETLNLAYKWTCSLELSAKTAFIARLAGTLA